MKKKYSINRNNVFCWLKGGIFLLIFLINLLYIVKKDCWNSQRKLWIGNIQIPKLSSDLNLKFNHQIIALAIDFNFGDVQSVLWCITDCITSRIILLVFIACFSFIFPYQTTPTPCDYSTIQFSTDTTMGLSKTTRICYPIVQHCSSENIITSQLNN